MLTEDMSLRINGQIYASIYEKITGIAISIEPLSSCAPLFVTFCGIVKTTSTELRIAQNAFGKR